VSPTLIGAIGIFLAMVLMRMTYRTARRERPDGIRWRGIQWNKDDKSDDEPPEDPPST
jgi:hypothetical protein